MRTEEQILAHLRAMQDTARSTGTLGEEYQKVYNELIAFYKERVAIKPPPKVWNADISQAPKDGTKIVIIDIWDYSAICWFDDGWWRTTDDELYHESQIVAWMLIPPLDLKTLYGTIYNR